MKNLNQKRTVFSIVLNTVTGQRNEELSANYFSDEKKSIINMFVQLTALLLTLPAITALLLVWFKIK